MRFKGQVVLITGGARGIGKNVSERFVEEGANVVIADIQKDLAEKTAKELRTDDCEVVSICTDVTKLDQINNMIDFTLKKFGRLDVLVNNAGIQIRCPSIDLSEEDWDKVMNVNLKAVFFCSQAAAKVMIKQKSGKIINISSAACANPLPERAPYTISKTGINALTAVLSTEWAKYGIRINSVVPGWIYTQMLEDGFQAGVISRDRTLSVTPMKRLGSTKDIADGIIFLASDEADFITGTPLYIDGGWCHSDRGIT
jgi:NAD(P)-dependent dehydrogenase (short-subunit alcohol dehydrogenase family)